MAFNGKSRVLFDSRWSKGAVEGYQPKLIDHPPMAIDHPPMVIDHHPKVIDQYRKPRNIGSLNNTDKDVGTGLARSDTCGDIMKLHIRVNPDGKIIIAKFKTLGCGFATASGSLATEWVKGKTVGQVLELKYTDIGKELLLPPDKLHCSMLAEDAIRAAPYNKMALNVTTKLLKITQHPLKVAAASYHPKVIDHYENPRNVGSLDKTDKNVGTGLVGAPACGDVMKLQIKVDDDGKIIDAKFKTFGCGSAIASSSLATEWVKGKTVDQALELKNTDIAKELSLPPVKLHCSMLAEDAIKAALSDYRIKQKSTE
ncbi:hypothetical protein FQA39_LY03490 [Lamprigera yunnana]|nr:hypothetical protein FQA39_LY03490 [Lamprigera yunnana]